MFRNNLLQLTILILLSLASNVFAQDLPAPNFQLLDVNSTSPTHNMVVSPRDFLGGTSAWYFGGATWGYCRSQFGFLDQMQMELFAENPETTIRILGINQIGEESGNGAICNGRDIPWLQDTDTDQVWAEWQVTYRDVVVLDDNNTQAGVYNLTFNDLGDPSNYAELKQILEDVAANSSDCEGNFNCDEDQDVDGSDASLFKTDFGRSAFNNPCETVDPCNGDFDCDNDCDGTDASVFKFDFGRSSFKNPCPACVVGEWCSY